MDHRPDASRLGTACLEPLGTRPGAAAVTCDQAIVTCIRSPMGHGYRVVAASDGLQRGESTEIASRAPSGDGLCTDSPTATGMSFFGLGSGRYAVLHVAYAGKEPTGRGGQRTYTRAMILDADGLRRFRCNPFEVLRAAESAGMLVVDLEASRTVPKVSLTPCPSPTAAAEALGRISPQWCGHLVEKILSNRELIIAADENPVAIAEALLLATPSPCRPSVSISAGLRVSVNRSNRLTLIQGDGTRARQFLRGRPADFVNLTAAANPPSPPDHPWAQATERLLVEKRTSRLVDLASVRFTQADVDAIESIGRACLDLDNIRTASTAELMDTATAYVGRGAMSPLQAELAEQIVRAARDQVTVLIRGMDATALAAFWPDLMAVAKQADLFAQVGAELVRRAIVAASRVAPLEAMKMALEAADHCGLGWSAEAAAVSLAKGFDQILRTVPQRAADWVATAELSDLVPARELVSRWGERFRGGEPIAELLSRIDARLNEQPGTH
jgi:hypothetical protein